MTAPAIPLRQDEDPLEALKALKQRSAPDPLDELKALKQGHDYHAEYRSGALAKRMQGANARDAANLADEEASTPSVLTQVGERTAANLANVAQGIPGMERVQAGVGAAASRLPGMGRNLTYRESLKALRDQTNEIPAAARYGERIAGALPLTAILPANPAVAGAVLGGADQALSADEMSGLERGARTAGGAALGAVLGKTAEKVGTSLKARFTPSPADNIIARQAERAASAKRLFAGAKSESEFKEMTPQIKAYLAEPEIASRVEQLQQMDQFKNVPAESYDMLDALHKMLSDESHLIQKGQAAVDPSKPNLGRFRGQNVRALKDRLLNVMETPGQKVVPAPETAPQPKPDIRTALKDFQARPGIAGARREGTIEQQMARQALERHGAENIVSPSLRGEPTPTVEETSPLSQTYRMANEDFAKRSKDIEAVGKGMNAMQGPVRPSFKQIMSKDTKTPQTFAEWARTATPSQLQASREGILGDVRNAFSEPGWRLKEGRAAAAKAGPMLRGINPNETDNLKKVLAIFNSPFANPD